MFMGQYGHNIDSKGRTIIPSKYREGLGDTFVITRGLDGCLFLYPMPEWEKFVDKLQQLPSSQKTRKIQRQFLSKAMEVSWTNRGGYLCPRCYGQVQGLRKKWFCRYDEPG